MEPNSRNRDLTYLNQLSTEELENMLRADLYAPDGGDSDLALAITEVILERENEDEESRQAQTQRAWEDFQQYYRTPEGQGVPLYPEEETDSGCKTSDTEPPLASPRRRSTPRRILIAVAVIAALTAISLIPVFGYKNVIQMMAIWTTDQFTFRAMGAYVEPSQEDLEYFRLKEELKEYGIEQQVLPRVPDGFRAEEPQIWKYPETGKIEIRIFYKRDSDYIMLALIREDVLLDKLYEKVDNIVDEHIKPNYEYYTFNNNNNRNIAAWYTEGLKCSISTTLSESELKEIVNSIS